ncbi:uncharacterized protein LOC123985951 [Scomber scombrus]|uniref:Uncharacterized protein LOC123985951 n=1 Tax=Scomber scombrus TaxID=13677 RepID=A0AAV1PSV1_SCOSC
MMSYIKYPRNRVYWSSNPGLHQNAIADATTVNRFEDIMSNLSDDFCVVRSQVLPSQRQGQKTYMYQSWAVVTRRSSSILTANCTCMAGGSESGCCTGQDKLDVVTQVAFIIASLFMLTIVVEVIKMTVGPYEIEKVINPSVMKLKLPQAFECI